MDVSQTPSSKYIISPTQLYPKRCFGRGRGTENRGLEIQVCLWTQVDRKNTRQAGGSCHIGLYKLYTAQGFQLKTGKWGAEILAWALPTKHMPTKHGLNLTKAGFSLIQPSRERIACAPWNSVTPFEKTGLDEMCLLNVTSFNPILFIQSSKNIFWSLLSTMY